MTIRGQVFFVGTSWFVGSVCWEILIWVVVVGRMSAETYMTEEVWVLAFEVSTIMGEQVDPVKRGEFITIGLIERGRIHVEHVVPYEG